jgi:hypothetical protein
MLIFGGDEVESGGVRWFGGCDVEFGVGTLVSW